MAVFTVYVLSGCLYLWRIPMVNDSASGTKRSLILAGGGIKVAFQAGVMQVWLDEAGLTFDHVDGASGGLFNLAMLCQGMSGTEIADRWRATRPLAGLSVNWRELLRPLNAESLLTLDGYRRNIFPRWGLDWDTIRSSETDATFNVYNFSRHELEVLPPRLMSEDLLLAGVSLPMWFPPVRLEGSAYIDAVYVTDANVEEALARGADEIWVIWTVSQRGIWKPGFVSTYFQIIEAAANGHFRRVRKRIDENNAAVAAGEPGEFGKHVELKILAAEVPLHYILDVSADRLHEVVNRGVVEARDWCARHGITVQPQALPASSSTPVSLEFTEDMTGYVGVGESDQDVGFAKGRRAGTPFAVHVTVRTEDVDRFVTDPDHVAALSGYVTCDAFGGTLPVQEGTFNLLVDGGDPTRKEMRYRIHAEDGEGKPLTVVGVKRVQSGDLLQAWRETTTLYTTLLRGHVTPEEDDYTDIAAAGIIRITLPAFLRQLTTFRTSGPSVTARATGLARYGALFLGKLWDVYSDSLLHPGPTSAFLVGKVFERPKIALRKTMSSAALH
ncbi:MAG: patatin-like phospholipase family protein [Pseudonocardiaceae bacterium]